ncbi:MAG: acetyl/propionyl/methylcrotonyl-CoA carboxylase subunit alpha, partial [Chitinophagales bacterium]
MPQINTILIANRGEIACRILRTCRKMGIQSIAVFSDADSNALYVRQADLAIHIGASSPSLSYLNQAKIIEVAQTHGADAIHPGYGFLSENADFAKKCAVAGIIFIGPNPDAIAAMGSKSAAKAMMKAHGVPVIPGYQGADQSLETLLQAAEQIGYPLLLKATAGGGGKGMRLVEQAGDLEKSILAAKREAKAAFGEEELIIEKYIAKGRHIEFQIFGDQHGNALHLLERECSIQRRYQKVLEESPSPVLEEALRQKMGDAAVQAAKALNYENAGTVEFIFDDQSREFFFLEVNTRLQVEHPVTEAITGLDLVQLQIEVAEGQPLSITQNEVMGNGYAIEARLYAEDASKDFMPATGKVQLWEVPEVDGLRVETAIESGSVISTHYDPMIAKLIVWDKNRSTAHRKMTYTLKHLKCLGLTTNQDFLLHLFQQKAINEGNYDTHYLQNHFDASALRQKTNIQQTVALIGLSLFGWKQRDEQRNLLRALPSGWHSNPYTPQATTYRIGEEETIVKYNALAQDHFDYFLGETTFKVELVSCAAPHIAYRVDGRQYALTIVENGKNKQQETIYALHGCSVGNIIIVEKARFPQKVAEKIKGGFEAPMPSQVVKVLVAAGQTVKAGDGLLVLSSMKMENTITATTDGIIQEIYATTGQNVEAGFLLL